MKTPARQTGGKDMKCRQAFQWMGPYMDGELSGEISGALEAHLRSCPRCARRLQSMRDLVREVSSLPTVEPTPAESRRIMKRVRHEMEAPATPRPAVRWAPVATVAFSILVLVSAASLLAVLSTGEPAVQVEETAPLGSAAGNQSRALADGESASLDAAGAAVVPASLAQPVMVVSGNEYAAGDLADFSGDIGTRLKFYSAYWQPSVAGTAALVTRDLQQKLVEDLAGRAQAAGEDAQGLRSALEAALAQTESKNLLPCYAELAVVEGRKAWLVSLSGPEDCLLFPDPEIPQSVLLASLGGEEGLRTSRSLLQELVSGMPPLEGAVPGELSKRTALDGEAAAGTQTEAPQSAGGSADSTREEAALRAEWEKKFQAFLDRIAPQYANTKIIKAMERLNYEQVLMFLAGDWSGLAAGGVNLSELLTPPKRLWAVDAANGEVVWSPK